MKRSSSGCGTTVPSTKPKPFMFLIRDHPHRVTSSSLVRNISTFVFSHFSLTDIPSPDSHPLVDPSLVDGRPYYWM